jgi:four helix bundle protein
VTGDKKLARAANGDRLETFGIYQLARRLFEDFWNDSEILSRDYRGRELSKQQIRSLDSICANMEESFGRGLGKELPQHLKISRGEARESRGRYERCNHLLPFEIVTQRVAALTHIIGGLSKTIQTIGGRSRTKP